MVFFILFSTGTYAGIGTKCVESENNIKDENLCMWKSSILELFKKGKQANKL